MPVHVLHACTRIKAGGSAVCRSRGRSPESDFSLIKPINHRRIFSTERTFFWSVEKVTYTEHRKGSIIHRHWENRMNKKGSKVVSSRQD